MSFPSPFHPKRKRPRRRASARRLIQLERSLALCQHGHELRETAVDELSNGWIVWGRYDCSQCGRLGLDHVTERPDVILVDGQRFIPRRVSEYLTAGT